MYWFVTEKIAPLPCQWHNSDPLTWYTTSHYGQEWPTVVFLWEGASKASLLSKQEVLHQL